MEVRGHYILNGKIPIVCKDLIEWGTWFETADRIVAKTMVRGMLVSTVFLGLDHDYGFNPEPILFETMVFNGEFDLYQRRYTNWAEAEAGHQETVDKITLINSN